MVESNTWHDSVPNALQFEKSRNQGISALAKNPEPRADALRLLSKVAEHGFGLKHKWLGVPIVRLPEDLVFQQDLIFTEKPDLVVEIGVARGGGLVYNASIQHLCNLTPNVIGVDNKIFPHTKLAIQSSTYSGYISLLEGDSISSEIVESVASKMRGSERTLLILDSDHASAHVLAELNSYAPHLPIGSLILICDTLIDEFPAGTFTGRTWENGVGPLTAIRDFLDATDGFVPDYVDQTNSLLLSEIRNGVLRKIG